MDTVQKLDLEGMETLASGRVYVQSIPGASYRRLLLLGRAQMPTGTEFADRLQQAARAVIEHGVGKNVNANRDEPDDIYCETPEQVFSSLPPQALDDLASGEQTARAAVKYLARNHSGEYLQLVTGVINAEEEGAGHNVEERHRALWGSLLLYSRPTCLNETGSLYITAGLDSWPRAPPKLRQVYRLATALEARPASEADLATAVATLADVVRAVQSDSRMQLIPSLATPEGVEDVARQIAIQFSWLHEKEPYHPLFDYL